MWKWQWPTPFQPSKFVGKEQIDLLLGHCTSSTIQEAMDDKYNAM
jgi:hypothetical protein